MAKIAYTANDGAEFIHFPGSYEKHIVALEGRKMRMEALAQAVRAHDAGDVKDSVLTKAQQYLAFLKGE